MVDISGEGLYRAFAQHIQISPVPSKLRSHSLRKYQGEGDTLDHLATLTDAMVLLQVSDELLCRLFISTLANSAQGWFTNLPPACMHSFTDMRSLFLAHFSSSKKPVKISQSLFSLCQGEKENLRYYITQFTKASHEVEDKDSLVTKMVIIYGLHRSAFKWSLTKNPPATLEALLQKAGKFINAE